MSYVSAIRAAFHALLRALHYSSLLCHYADLMNRRVQASNASEAIKTSSTALLGSIVDFCDTLRAFKTDLPH